MLWKLCEIGSWRRSSLNCPHTKILFMLSLSRPLEETLCMRPAPTLTWDPIAYGRGRQLGESCGGEQVNNCILCLEVESLAWGPLSTFFFLKTCLEVGHVLYGIRRPHFHHYWCLYVWDKTSYMRSLCFIVFCLSFLNIILMVYDRLFLKLPKYRCHSSFDNIRSFSFPTKKIWKWKWSFAHFFRSFSPLQKWYHFLSVFCFLLWRRNAQC